MPERPLKFADVKIVMTVSFEDNGIADLRDQAVEAAVDALPSDILQDADIEIVGNVRDTGMPNA